MRTMSCFAIAAGFLCAIAACGGTKEDKQQSAGSAAPVAPAAAVEIFVNDASVAKVARAQLDAWPRLDTLVPVEARRLGTWDKVYLKGRAKASELNKPGSTYPDMVPVLYPGAGGEAAFGMFDPVELAKKGAPGLHQDGVTEIRIVVAQGTGRGEHESGDGGGADPATLKLAIKQASGESVLTGTQLLAMPREEMPGNADSKGWKLSTLLAAAGVTSYRSLLLTDAAGMNLTLEKKDFDDLSVVPFVKLNKQGALRFRILKKVGDGWQPSGDLRALQSIEAK